MPSIFMFYIHTTFSLIKNLEIFKPGFKLEDFKSDF